MAWVIYLLLLFTTNTISIRGDNEDDERRARVCYGNSTEENYVYQTNIHSLLSSFVSESSSSHPPSFFKTAVGEAPPRAYGTYLCRGDIGARRCHNCLVKLTEFLAPLEIYNTECYAYQLNYDCIVHYSNSSKFVNDEVEEFNGGPIGDKVITNYRQYNETLSNATRELITEASYGNWTKPNSATRVVEVIGSHEKIYMMVQCTPDISAMNCSKCLGKLYPILPDCCNGTQGGQILHANCFMMYNNQSFFSSAYHNHMPHYIHVILIMLLNMYFV
ncbi:hypothetical protein BVRB_8g190820 [Beta vulgaris subsp. vulgaris]|nr:hypothetical protein BVRB_8g190820 [Beta vulgaris subsp. vulgaris]